MASIQANGSKGHHKFILEVKQASQSVANNTSSVSFTFKIAPIETTWNWEQWGAYIKYTVTINGTAYTGSIDNYDGSSTVTLKSGTQTITHNADGTKSFSYSFSVTDTSGVNYTSGNASASGTMALTTIARASSVSGGSGNIGGTTNIAITRASSSFTHTLKYSFGSLTGTIATGVGTSYTWTIPTSFYSQIPNSNTGTGSITCETYNGSTLIGSKSVNFTAKVTNSNPTFSASNLSYADTNSTVVAITGNNKHIVQNKSNLKLTYTSATAKNSSTIKSYSFTLNGVTKTSTSAGGTIDFGTINSASNLNLYATVTDSRGNTTSTAIIVTMLPYTTPSTLTTLERKNNYEDETYITVNGAVASVNGKNKIVTLQYRYRTPNGSYGSYYSIASGTKYTLTLPKENVYIFEIIIKDSFGAITVKEAVLNKGVFPMFIDTVKNSIGINKFPTKNNCFEIDGNLTYTNKFIHSANYGAGSQGYLKFVEITVKAEYINKPIEFKIGRRQSYIYTTLSLMFASTNNLDPSLQGFETRWWNIPIYALKTSASNWSLYIQKVEAYDDIVIADFTKGNYLTQVEVNFTNDFVATLPTGTVQAQYYQVPMHKTLYENADGTTGTITLNDSVANFRYLEIYYMDNLKADVQSIKVLEPNNKIVALTCVEASESERIYIRVSRFTLVGTAITFVRGAIGTLQNGYDPTVAMTPYVRIVKIVGYR
jgi:hypothetical protein